MIKVSITGDQELRNKLTELKTSKAKAAIRKGTRQGCKLIMQAARDNAPVGKTRKLRKSIKVKAMKAKKGVGCTVNLTIFYAGFLEYGLSKRKLTAREFLKRAAETKGEEAAKTACDIIKQEIEKA